jgi:hypothetical protein
MINHKIAGQPIGDSELPINRSRQNQREAARAMGTVLPTTTT